MNLLADTMKSIKALSEKTDRVLLFHSANGKDSIALLEMLSPYFKEVKCVYMYMVKDLSHINKYILWAEKRYKNASFIQTPHYAYYNYKKLGICGTNEINYAQYNLSTITEKIREETGIQWVVYGFKQNDSLNRRLMLRTYENEIINEETQKIYPLSKWSNKEVLQFISKKRLIEPLQYGNVGNTRSQGTDVTNLSFLLWCRANAPEDLKRVIKEFPDTERILFEYDYEKQNKAI
ncbi:phosphoadenosine phosphosulfate reductase domain-containing protein [Riemerella anatipestifer]|uniref:phosphoadenosine phosphosulfate reductase domain-containing protein n=1 Tax=Riemerella anatipestifer TaxID=34085 RepID=UPI0021D5A0E8|nr:phosphoadenosine phosphosulfate reductase family protein [Riemerella anatipestifer]MCU7583619.1 phosphoadenosine phosphosulfate reductase family protein [Riemerella anatipestifer]WCS66374.1 hypothetical protein CRP5_000019 [Riemerella phage vB_RanS_CRP5]WIL01318.1 hypothetical protein CRP6_000038 [Riemerella phage vB_RanS_CRP6]